MGIKERSGRSNAWIYVDVKGVDIGTYVQMAMRPSTKALPKGRSNCRTVIKSLERRLRTHAPRPHRLLMVVPLTLLIIILIIYLTPGPRSKP